jgi:integrase
MPEKVVEALRLHQTNQNIQQAKAGGLWHNTGLVFTTQIGTGIYPSNFRREFNKVIAKANLGRWHPHELRHTAISLLSDKGVRLEDIADVVGHSTTRMTSEVYRHQVQESISAHIKTMNKMFDDN